MVGGQRNSLDMALDKVAITIGQWRAGAAGGEVIAQRRNDERLELGGGNAADRSGRVRFLLPHGLGDVITVARAALVGMGRAHAAAALIKDAAEPRARRPAQTAPPTHRLRRQI